MDLFKGEANKQVKWGPWVSLVVGVVAFLLPLFILGLGFAIYAQTQDKDPTTLFDDLSLGSLFLVNIFAAVSATAIILWFTKSRGGIKALGLKMMPNWQHFKKALAAYGVYFVTFIAVFALLRVFFPELDLGQEQQLEYDEAAGFVEHFYTFAALIIVAPIYEEILFRGFAFQGLANSFGFLPSAIVVSGLFGLAHEQFNVAIDTFILGVIASWLVWKTKSLWPAILLHGIKNSIAFAVKFLL